MSKPKAKAKANDFWDDDDSKVSKLKLGRKKIVQVSGDDLWGEEDAEMKEERNEPNIPTIIPTHSDVPSSSGPKYNISSSNSDMFDDDNNDSTEIKQTSPAKVAITSPPPPPPPPAPPAVVISPSRVSPPPSPSPKVSLNLVNNPVVAPLPPRLPPPRPNIVAPPPPPQPPLHRPSIHEHVPLFNTSEEVNEEKEEQETISSYKPVVLTAPTPPRMPPPPRPVIAKPVIETFVPAPRVPPPQPVPSPVSNLTAPRGAPPRPVLKSTGALAALILQSKSPPEKSGASESSQLSPVKSSPSALPKYSSAPSTDFTRPSPQSFTSVSSTPPPRPILRSVSKPVDSLPSVPVISPAPTPPRPVLRSIASPVETKVSPPTLLISESVPSTPPVIRSTGSSPSRSSPVVSPREVEVKESSFLSGARSKLKNTSLAKLIDADNSTPIPASPASTINSSAYGTPTSPPSFVSPPRPVAKYGTPASSYGTPSGGTPSLASPPTPTSKPSVPIVDTVNKPTPPTKPIVPPPKPARTSSSKSVNSDIFEAEQLPSISSPLFTAAPVKLSSKSSSSTAPPPKPARSSLLMSPSSVVTLSANENASSRDRKVSSDGSDLFGSSPTSNSTISGMFNRFKSAITSSSASSSDSVSTLPSTAPSSNGLFPVYKSPDSSPRATNQYVEDDPDMVGSALYNGYDRHSGRLSGKNLPKFASTSSKSRSLSQSDKTRQLSTEPNAPPPLPPKPKQVTYTKPARMQDTKGLYSGDAVQGLDNLFSTSAQSVSSSSGGITPGKPLVSSVNVEKRDKSILSTITKGISKAQVQKYEQVEESSLREEAAAPNSIREGKLIKIDGSGNEVLYYFILTVKCFCYTELKSVGDVEKLRVYPTTNLMAFPNEAGYKGEDGLSFRLLSKTKSFRVRAKTTEERDVWIKDISKIASERQEKELGRVWGPTDFAPLFEAKKVVNSCMICSQGFGFLTGSTRHHCRNCGKVVCEGCSREKVRLPHLDDNNLFKVCSRCAKEAKNNRQYGH